jgi:hypothetical protein
MLKEFKIYYIHIPYAVEIYACLFLLLNFTEFLGSG